MLQAELLDALTLFGLPVLFGVILLAAIGVPLPATLLLVAAGTFVEQGTLDLWWVMGVAAVAAIAGDNIGYGIGRWGGAALRPRLLRWAGGERRFRRWSSTVTRWGGAGIFLTRWLVPPLGPTVNLTSGIAQYQWPSFFTYESLGALLWVVLYTTLGRVFSDRARRLSATLGTAGWMILGLAAVLFLVWRVIHTHRRSLSHGPAASHTAARDDRSGT